MREQPDPVRLIVQLGAIAVLLVTVALSVGSLRDIPVARERFLIGGEQAKLDGHELARCRTMTTDRRPLDEACHRVWPVNRRLFLGLDRETGRAAATNILTTPSLPSSDNNNADAGRPTDFPLQKD